MPTQKALSKSKRQIAPTKFSFCHEALCRSFRNVIKECVNSISEEINSGTPTESERDPVFAAYVRKSVNDQRDNHSLDDQLNAIKQWAASNNYSIRDDLVFRDLASGALSDRSGLLSAFESMKSHDVNGIIVFKLDRLSRDTLHTLTLFKTMEESHVNFVSVTESNLRFGPMFTPYSDLQARTTLLVHCLIAETERINAQIRTKNTTVQRGLKDLARSEHAPYGCRFYCIVDGKRIHSARASDLKKYRNPGIPLQIDKYEPERQQMVALLAYCILYNDKYACLPPSIKMLKLLQLLRRDVNYRKEGEKLGNASNLKKTFHRWLQQQVEKGDLDEKNILSEIKIVLKWPLVEVEKQNLL